MKSISDFHIYQHRLRKLGVDLNFLAFWVDLGLGKSVVSLTILNDLLSWCEIGKPLIVAPRLVAETTWREQVQEWSHVNHLRLSRVIGTAAQRKKALTAEADIWIIGRDNLAWLVDLLGAMWPFDMVILDESTSFKSHDSLRFRKMKQVMKLGVVKRMIQLTGTPTPNGLLDLWAQIYLLDGGERLGTTFNGYRNRYFEGNDWTHKYTLRPGAEAAIHDKLKDISYSMRKEDWLDMKPREDVTRRVYLPNMETYKQFEKDAVLALEEAEITAVNAGVLYGKLLQFCNGAIYSEQVLGRDKEWHLVHDAKLDMLEEIIDNLNGEPVIVFYCFRSDIERITARIKKVKTLTGAKDPSAVIDAWNRKEIEVLLAHPASAGHGLNLQHGGHRIIWFGVPSALELYQQAVARLDRQGQTESVINMHLITEGTIEQEVVKRLIDKTLTQDTLIDALRAFKEEAIQYKESKVLVDLLA